MLNDEEEEEFRNWARDNYEIYTEINCAWHPITQDECATMNLEYYDENKTDFHY